MNICFSYLRRKKILQFVSLEGISKEKEPSLETSNPVDTYEKSELKSNVRKAILQLSPNQKMAIVLKHYNDLSYEEIADILNLTPQAVKSLIFRARENLKKILKDYISE